MTVTFFAGRAPRSARLVHFFCFLACWACLALMSVSAHAGAFEDALRAANDGDTATMQQLLGRGLDPDSSDADGNTLLMLAARGGHEGVVAALVQHRAKLYRRNRFGDDALCLAALQGHGGVVQKLLAAGTLPNRDSGWQPLGYAAFAGHGAVVKLLLDKGAQVDAINPNRATALMLAARNGHGAVVDLLLQRGADPGYRTESGEGPADWAVKGGNSDLAEHLRAAERQIIRLEVNVPQKAAEPEQAGSAGGSAGGSTIATPGAAQ